MSSTLWTEKHRPTNFDDIRGQKEIISRISAFVEKQNIPHLMFAGPPGVGKTSTALVIAKQMFGENWRQNVLELNASDERGIDVVRTKVKDFARTRAIGNVPFRICILDECDSLTKEAQQALRRTMENYTQTCRFILLANYSSKIIDPIQSRCAVFRFKPLSKEEIFNIVDMIAQKENVKVSPDGKEALYEVSGGDCRKLENIMQSVAAINNEVTNESVYYVASAAKPKEIKEILTQSLQNNFEGARGKLLETMLSQGLSGLDVIRQMQQEVLSLDIDSRKKLKMIEKCGDIEFRMVEGADEFIQLEALLSQFALLADA